jgi:hypothetical protein
MSREEIIRRIVQRDLQRQEMHEECVRQEEAPLHEAACEQFGAWEIALEYAGVSLRRVRFREEYPADRVLREIRKLCLNGYDLAPARNLRRRRRLYDAACRHFGTWNAALAEVGVNLERAFYDRRRRPDRDEVLEAIRRRRHAGRSLRWADVCREDRVCAVAAKTWFRSWRRALIAAGVADDDGPAPGDRE